jgi:hypothetical protein
MKAGMAVYLHQSPALRGNIARVEDDGIWVTWHKYVFDVPECLGKGSNVDYQAANRRMRVFYRKNEMSNIGLGVPA